MIDQREEFARLALAPGAAYGGAKRWPPEFFGELAAALAGDGVSCVMVGSGADAPTASDVVRAFRPHVGHDDAHRNLISNIHARGIPHEQAASRIARLAARMIEHQTSGVGIKEEWEPTAHPSLPSVPFPFDPR